MKANPPSPTMPHVQHEEEVVEEEEEVIETSAEEFDEEITFQDGSLIIPAHS